MNEIMRIAREMWELRGEGEMPADFAKTVESYMRDKCVFGSVAFTVEDFAACRMAYKLFKAFSRKAKKDGEKSE